MSLFEPISEDEFRSATSAQESKPPRAKKSKSINTDDRTQTGWWKLPTFMSYCTAPGHDEYQRTLNPEKLEYRQRFPVRMVCTIGDFDVCRDCYTAGIDKL